MNLPPKDPTARFSDRARDYARARPTYPAGVIEILRRERGLEPSHVVADLGSGTGIFARLLLEAGNTVFAVEPNREMRLAAEASLAGHPRFRSVDGRAEATTLGAASVDFVTAAQAFHWFDVDLARRECARILRPGGSVALVWNARRMTGTPFLVEYEELLRDFGVDYEEVKHSWKSGDFSASDRFFGPGNHRIAVLDNAQELDFEGLRARLVSSSYVPGESHPARGPMLEKLRRIFDRRQSDGHVRLEYDVKVIHGPLAQLR